jgi:hypothetical protein
MIMSLLKPNAKALLCSAAAAILFGVSAARAAVGLTISPATVTNDFAGKITLNITGLTIGQAVNVLIYADLNGNGVVDAGEPIVQAFAVTDGQAPTIGGVRNLNVPRDEDGLANGQIRAELFVPGVGAALIANAHYIIQVVNPSGNVVLTSQPYVIASKVLPQGVTGRITSATTGLPLTNTIIALQGIGAASPIFTVTDSHGDYLCYGLPYTYGIFVYESGYIDPITNLVAVNCGQLASNNVAFTAGPLTISGKVTDHSTGLGLPGMAISAKSTNAVQLQVFAFTDINGNYTLSVSGTNQWDVRPDQGAVSARGYIPLTSRTVVPVSSANVSSINFSLTNATALIYGTILDNHNNPVSGLQLTAGDSGGLFNARGESVATNGAYALAVVAGTSWNVTVGQADLLSRGYASQIGTNVSVTAGQATNVNFVVTRTNSFRLSSPARLSANEFQFLLNGLAGQNYTIQTLTNLDSTNWLAILETNAPCNSILLVDPQATNGSRFYRVLVTP